MSFSLIVATGRNGEIGVDGKLPWKLKDDTQYFRDVTMGHPMVMGFRTFLSLPLMLDGRPHYVVTHEPAMLEASLEGMRFYGEERPPVIPVTNLDEFIEAHRDEETEYFVIGGAMIYQQLLPFCDKLYITEIKQEFPEADTYFPEFDRSQFTREVIGEGRDRRHDLDYSFVVYTRK